MKKKINASNCTIKDPYYLKHSNMWLIYREPFDFTDCSLRVNRNRSFFVLRKDSIYFFLWPMLLSWHKTLKFLAHPPKCILLKTDRLATLRLCFGDSFEPNLRRQWASSHAPRSNPVTRRHFAALGQKWLQYFTYERACFAFCRASMDSWSAD